MSAEEALDEFERAANRYGEIAELRAGVLAQIATLRGELAYWDARADVAFSRMQIADRRLCDARDRARSELRKAKGGAPLVRVPA